MKRIRQIYNALASVSVWIGARYIYRELLFPFLFAISVVTFVLLTNFLIRSVDRLLGKGLDFVIIMEFLWLNLAWIVAMSVPMAVLVASLMAYGRLAEDNEITAMRACGISFIRILTPGIIFGIVVAAFMLYFHNRVLPDFNHRARLLTSDIYRLRPGLNLEPGYFMDDIPGYAIYVREKRGDHFRQITIYTTENREIQTTIYADSGYLEVEGDRVLFTLFAGEIHELNLTDWSQYRRLGFVKHRIAIPVDNLMLERSDSERRGDREMTIPMMREKVRLYQKEKAQVESKIEKLLKNELDRPVAVNLNTLKRLIESEQQANLERLSPENARIKNRKLNTLMTRLRGEFNLLLSYQKQINRYEVEIQKKLAIPFACVVFMLLGAPLGVMTRRGGITMAATMSLLFFLLYYVFLIGGEELADMAIISPFWAMWTSNFLLAAVGVILIWKTTYEQKTIDLAKLIWFRKLPSMNQ